MRMPMFLWWQSMFGIWFLHRRRVSFVGLLKVLIVMLLTYVFWFKVRAGEQYLCLLAVSARGLCCSCSLAVVTASVASAAASQNRSRIF